LSEEKNIFVQAAPDNYMGMIDRKESYSELLGSKKLKALFFIFLGAVALSIIYIFSYFFWPFLFALILYVALKPAFNFIKKYIKRSSFCSLLIILSIIFLVIIPMLFVLIILANQAYEFYQYLQQQYDTGVFNEFMLNSAALQKILSFADINQKEIFQQIIGVLSKTSLQIFSNVTALLSFSIKFILNLLSMLLILFFLFKDGDKLSKGFYKNLPFPEDIERDIVGRVNNVIKILFAGNLFIMILQGLVVGIGFWVFGLSMPLLWAAITAILSLIPAIGTLLIWVPAVIYLIATGSYISAIILGLWCLLGYLILENIVKTKLFGRQLNFHPLIFFFLLLGSIHAFNLPGVIIGPVLLSLFFSLWELYKLLDKYKMIYPKTSAENVSSV
jgi:predicted PurR-regulated permease PerM